jgi:hypothetical protein
MAGNATEVVLRSCKRSYRRDGDTLLTVSSKTTGTKGKSESRLLARIVSEAIEKKMKRFPPPLRYLMRHRPPLHYLGDPVPASLDLPKGALLISMSKLQHAPSKFVPLWYQDQPFKCRDCDAVEVWTAAQQKFYCEEQQGDPSARAIRCRACREKLNLEKRARREVQAKNRAAKLRTKSST